MLKEITSKLIGATLVLKFRLWRQNRSINISEHLAKVQSVLVYMPSKIVHFAAALKTLESLREKRPNWRITAITHQQTVKLIDERLKVEILPYSSQDLTFFGLPKGSIRRHFNNNTYDLALDLSLSLDPISIMLFQWSGAPLKVCLESKEKAPFYNFGIRVNNAEPLEKKYNAMLKYITVMADSKKQKETVTKTSQE
jgi:ADP-heptose:LPS heptosyltransferase